MRITEIKPRSQEVLAAFPGRSWWNTWTEGSAKHPMSDLDVFEFFISDPGVVDDQKQILEAARAKDGDTEDVRRVDAMFAAFEQYSKFDTHREFDTYEQFRNRK